MKYFIKSFLLLTLLFTFSISNAEYDSNACFISESYEVCDWFSDTDLSVAIDSSDYNLEYGGGYNMRRHGTYTGIDLDDTNTYYAYIINVATSDAVASSMIYGNRSGSSSTDGVLRTFDDIPGVYDEVRLLKDNLGSDIGAVNEQVGFSTSTSNFNIATLISTVDLDSSDFTGMTIDEALIFMYDYASADYYSPDFLPDLDVLYPEDGTSVDTPLIINGTYKNYNQYDQLGIDLYYLDETDTWINEFTWYSIPLEENAHATFSYPLDVEPDNNYYVIVSLNGDDDYIETDFIYFDTYGFVVADISPADFPEAPDCTDLTVFACVSAYLSWLFVPEPFEFGYFNTLMTTIKGTGPFYTASNGANVFKTVFVFVLDSDSFELTLPVFNDDVPVVSSATISTFPFLTFMRPLSTFGFLILFLMYLYKRLHSLL